ncbi:MAG TPA: acyl-CoA dehydrogenase family protein [Mycobacteriales bacterium]|nr:acyl-CoA dehydrogenase family protein [Mycobacteriales bacterium]
MSSGVSSGLTGEQEALKHLAADLFAKESPTEAVRRFASEEPGYDQSLWERCADLGLLGLEVPEELDGAGQGMRESSLVLAEIGARVVPGPYLSQYLCISALLACPPSASRDGWLAALGSGETVGAVVPAALGRGGLPELEARARPAPGGGLLLSGGVGFVLDAPSASLLVVAADGGDGAPVLVGVDGASLAAASVTDVPLVDMTRRAAAVGFDDVGVNGDAVLASGEQAEEVLDRLRCLSGALIAVDSVAGASAALARTVAYVSNRHQFGRPVGTFQAVKHRCADMFVSVETARVATDAAVGRLASGEPADYWCSAAKAVAAGAYAKVAGNAVQLHGGIGFTWDYDLHLWLKRAKLNESLFGDTRSHRARIARWLWNSQTKTGHE